MDTLEKTISNFVEQQFPAVFRELGPTFVLFVKKYYEWMEQPDNVLYHTRRLYEYRDIDETTDAFLVHFKETYLKNIQLGTVQNTRTLVKHSLDLYRSKGTEQSIELLFRLAFGTDAEIYYPRDDIFRSSDGHWFEPEYLEVTISDHNSAYVGMQIQGEKSKATAYVEKAIRRYAGNHMLTDVLYISSREGNFETGETITRMSVPDDQKIPKAKRSIVIGSLSSLQIDVNGSGANFVVGDIVDIHSSLNGIGGKARISEISPTTGQVTLVLIDGGYGYNSNSHVLISEQILTVNGQHTFNLFETVYQPLANLNYLNATGNFNVGDTIVTKYPNNATKGTGKVLSINLSNTTAGNLYVEVTSGNLQSNVIYDVSASPAITANLSILSGFEDKQASGNVIGWSINTIANTTKVGVMDITHAFTNSASFYTTISNVSDQVITTSQGAGLGFSISNSMLYEEYAMVDEDYLSTYANTLLSANNYGFKGTTPNTNSNTLLSAINWSNTIFGKIQFLIGVNPGSSYNDYPFISIYDDKTAPLQRHDLIIKTADSPLPFQVGELITQEATNARGLIVDKNIGSQTLIIQNLRVSPNNDFVATTNSTTIIIGSNSAFEANIVSIDVDYSSEVMGWNADLSTKLDTSNGAVAMTVIDSGFGYVDGEYVTFSKSVENLGYAFANVSQQGIGQGYYKEKGGFLSDQKKLYDGYYYQEFSYDVLSSLALDQYQKLLKDVVHTAGYQLFGTVKHRSRVSANRKTASSKVSQS